MATTITTVHLGDGDYETTFDQDSVAAGSEAVMDLKGAANAGGIQEHDREPLKRKSHKITVHTFIANKSSGTALTIAPVLGNASNPSGKTLIGEADANAQASIGGPVVGRLDKDMKLWVRWNPASAADNVVDGVLRWSAGWPK